MKPYRGMHRTLRYRIVFGIILSLLFLTPSLHAISSFGDLVPDEAIVAATQRAETFCGSNLQLFDLETYFTIKGEPNVFVVIFYQADVSVQSRSQVLASMKETFREREAVEAQLDEIDQIPQSEESKAKAVKGLRTQLTELRRQQEGRNKFCTVFLDANRPITPLHVLKRLPDHLANLPQFESTQKYFGTNLEREEVRYVFHGIFDQFYARFPQDRENYAFEVLSSSKLTANETISANEVAQLTEETTADPTFSHISSGKGYTAVVTHGFIFPGDFPSWVNDMGDAIRDRIDGDARVFRFNATESKFTDDPGPSSPSCGSCNSIVKVFWNEVSNDPGKGFSEATGDAVYQALMDGQAQGKFSLENLHFIGHSRGTVVNSEAIERLLYTKSTISGTPQINVTQVTTLDPHDSGAPGSFNWTDYDVNPTLNLGVVAWQGQDFSDNYYSINWNTILDPYNVLVDLGLDGRDVNGASDILLGNDLHHSDVWAWYLGTICTTCDPQPPSWWYGQDGRPERQTGGFNLTNKIQSGQSLTFSEYNPSGSKSQIQYYYESQLQGIINGDFRRHNWVDLFQKDLPGWKYYGGGGDGHVRSDHLVLDTNNASKTHNYIYIPSSASAITYKFRVNNKDGLFANDAFEFWFVGESTPRKSKILGYESPANTWETHEITLLSSDKGKRKRFEVRINPNGDDIDSEVWLDNFVFKIGPDSIPPVAESHIQTSSVSTNIEIYFSEPINESTLSGSVSVVGSVSGNHATSLYYSESNNKLTINPNSNFAYSESVTVVLSTNIKDLAGNAMAGPYSFDFQTQSPAGVSPPVPGNVIASNGTQAGKVRVWWDPANSATHYKVFRAPSAGGVTTLIEPNVNASPYDDFTVLGGTEYQYSVKACNDYGCSGLSVSDRGYAGTGTPPPSAPTGVTAWDGITNAGILISWNAVSEASYYQLWRATSLSGDKTPINVNWESPSWADVFVTRGRTYYYWVKACRSDGICSDFSAPDTGYASDGSSQPLYPPTNPDPEHDATNVSTNTEELDWSNGGGAKSYDVYFGTSSTLDSEEFLGTTNESKFDVSNMADNTTYYWRIDAKASGQIVQGPVWRFTTRADSAGPLPKRAVNPTPVHYAEDVSLATTLYWQNGGGATSYDVYFGTNVQPGAGQYVGNTTATSWPLPQLEYGNVYYWQIKARNDNGVVNGTVWRFKTEPTAPSPPIWPHPTDAQTELSTITGFLEWTDSSGRASSFDVYFGTDPTPDAGEFVANTTVENWQYPTLLPQTTYYWQIMSKNTAGAAYGPVWSFTTWATTPALLSVSPGTGLSSAGEIAGPFEPSEKSFTLSNIGNEALTFNVTNTHVWIDISPSSGTLQPGEEALVLVSINSGAHSLPGGYHSDSIRFKNLSGSRGDTDRAVVLSAGLPLDAWDIEKIVGGYLSVLAIKSDGSLHGWGSNGFDQLGLGSPSQGGSPAPIPLSFTNDWADIAATYHHNLALKKDGSLYAWGENDYGQLGLGDTTPRATPTRVGIDNDWVEVAAGAWFSIARKADGRLFAFGRGEDGRLGLGDLSDRLIPTQIGLDNDWKSISVGYHQTLAVKANGTLYTWGDNAGSDGKDRLAPTQVGVDSDWVKTSAGNYSILALKANGSLYAWGDNSQGQLGLGDTDARLLPTRVGTQTDWVDITAGGDHSLGVRSGGKLYAWGYNNWGQLGIGNRTDQWSPVFVFEDPEIHRVTATYYSSFVLLNDGSLLAWGSNDNGELGAEQRWTGFTNQRELLPVAVDLNWAVIPEPVQPISADLAISKTDGQSNAMLGSTIQYTILVANYGPSSVSDALVTDVFPTELTCSYSSLAAGGATGNTSSSSGDISDTLTLPAGGSVTYTVPCNIDAVASGTLSNTATVNSAVDDPEPNNNSSKDTTNIVPEVIYSDGFE